MAFIEAQKELDRAQREAASARIRNAPQAAARDLIYDQWAYEKLGVMGLPSLKPGKDHPEALVRALAVTDESEVASGEALNHVLVAIVAAENKGAKGPSAFLPPRLLDDLRFAGPPTADALNLLRQADNLPLPAAFFDPRLKEASDLLERDFAAAAEPLRAGKSADRAKIARLEQTLSKVQEQAAPVIRTLPFEDAIAARRFLNKLEATVKAMKTNAVNGLVNANWATEGTSVADLVKHLTKHKLLFGPAPAGGEPAYLALHKGLATYLIALTQKK
jgi:hypothetical protein